MVIDLGKRNAAFVRVMMTFIPHFIPVFCTLLYYSIFCVPYMGLLQPFSLVFSLKGSLPTRGYWHVKPCMQVDHKKNVFCNCMLISDRFNVYGISAEEEIFCSINEINCFREIPRLLDRACNATKQEIWRIQLRSPLISTRSLYHVL